jgi:hypothetical protein
MVVGMGDRQYSPSGQDTMGEQDSFSAAEEVERWKREAEKHKDAAIQLAQVAKQARQEASDARLQLETLFSSSPGFNTPAGAKDDAGMATNGQLKPTFDDDYMRSCLNQSVSVSSKHQPSRKSLTATLTATKEFIKRIDYALPFWTCGFCAGMHNAAEVKKLKNQLAAQMDELAAQQDKRIAHLARKALGVFMHRELKKAMGKWRGEVLRTRKVAKVAMRWMNRAIAQAWSTWYSIILEQTRLRSILARLALRWKNRVRTMFLSCITI